MIGHNDEPFTNCYFVLVVYVFTLIVAFTFSESIEEDTILVSLSVNNGAHIVVRLYINNRNSYATTIIVMYHRISLL